MERLSSGKRINSAADDAAGMAISTNMTSQINGLAVSIRNISDGLSMMQTADASLGEVSNILQRMRELTVQAASGTYSTRDRAALQIEMDQSVEQIDSILAKSSFNGSGLFSDTSNANEVNRAPANASDHWYNEEDHRMSGAKTFLSSYPTGSAQFQIQTGADAGQTAEASLKTLYSPQDGFTFLGKDMQFSNGNTRFVGLANIDLTAPDSVDVRRVDGFKYNVDPSNYLSYSPTGNRSYNFKAGFIDSRSAGNVYAPLKVSAEDGIAVIDAALDTIVATRADIGAFSNRLTSQMGVAESAMTNLTQARSQIQDADFSVETVSLAKSQILAQASAGMISHANMNAQDVLKLLK